MGQNHSKSKRSPFGRSISSTNASKTNVKPVAAPVPAPAPEPAPTDTPLNQNPWTASPDSAPAPAPAPAPGPAESIHPTESAILIEHPSPILAPADPQPEIPDIGPDDALIAIMGLTGVGKSTFISHFSPSTAIIGNDLESCTSTISFHPTTLPGIPRRVVLIDTPGFNDTTRTDTSILSEIAGWLAEDVKLAGIVYLHRIQDNRVSGSAAKNIDLFRELCGSESLASVVLATTMWDSLPTDKAEAREAELKGKKEFWGGLVESGCAVMRQDEGAKSAERIVRHVLEQRREVTLQIQEEIAEGVPLHETGAGAVLEAELREQRRVYEGEVERLREVLRGVEAEVEGLRGEQERKERERGREMEGLRGELKALREELAATREKQERTDKEYKDFTTGRGGWRARCVVM
ncbi:P-loop containing nucleoside triphosphate hydrolase protein [Podospora conica]|nr:P-loop containing nucleoside triphosphate hydrolase protein [Schizothecium conicum]